MQTFPDDYFFSGSWSLAMCGLGNSVPVLLAEIIGNDIIQAFKGISK